MKIVRILIPDIHMSKLRFVYLCKAGTTKHNENIFFFFGLIFCEKTLETCNLKIPILSQFLWWQQVYQCVTSEVFMVNECKEVFSVDQSYEKISLYISHCILLKTLGSNICALDIWCEKAVPNEVPPYFVWDRQRQNYSHSLQAVLTVHYMGRADWWWIRDAMEDLQLINTSSLWWPCYYCSLIVLTAAENLTVYLTSQDIPRLLLNLQVQYSIQKAISGWNKGCYGFTHHPPKCVLI